jgi:hypothetical protein
MPTGTDQHNWYYAEGERAIGPLSLSDLRKILRAVSEWRKVLIWREGFDRWTRAGDVPELIPTPPPIPKAASPVPSVRSGIPPAELIDSKKEEVPKPGPPRWSAKKIIAGAVTLIAVIIGAAFGKVIGKAVYQTISGALQPSNAEVLAKGQAEGARQLKLKVPMKLDEVTTLVDAASEGATAIYYYQLDVAIKLDQTVLQNLKNTVLGKTCKTDMRRMTDLGATYRYVYQDKQGRRLGSFDFIKGDCDP